MVVKLTQTERVVLSAIHLNASDPLSVIAQRCGIAEHVVRYTVKKFQALDLIRRRPLINSSALGFNDFVIYLSLSHSSNDSKLAFERALQCSEKIGDVLELGGEYRYGFVYCCQDVSEAASFVNALAEFKGVHFFERVIGIRITATLYRRRYLAGRVEGQVSKIVTSRDSNQVSLDDLDNKLLRALHATHESYRDIARTLSVAPSTVLKRLNHLKQSGVVRGEVYGMQVQKIGMLSYRLLISLRRSSENIRARVAAFCDRSVSVVVCNEIFGSWNYEILAEVRDTNEIVEVVQELYESLQDDIAGIKTLPLFQFLKVTDYPLEVKK